MPYCEKLYKYKIVVSQSLNNATPLNEYDPNCPVVCMDEQPVQLVQETRPPMAATKNRPGVSTTSTNGPARPRLAVAGKAVGRSEGAVALLITLVC